MAGEFLKAYLSVQKDFEIVRVLVYLDSSELTSSCGTATQERHRHQGLCRRSLKAVSAGGDLKRSAHPVRRQVLVIRRSRAAQAPHEGCEAWHRVVARRRSQPETPSRRAGESASQGCVAHLASIASIADPPYPRAAETKREEAGRFIRARSDPAFAKMVRVRQLGPEQMENQRKIRLQMQAAIASADQLEEHMLNLKKRMTDEKLGRQSFKCVLQFVPSISLPAD